MRVRRCNASLVYRDDQLGVSARICARACVLSPEFRLPAPHDFGVARVRAYAGNLCNLYLIQDALSHESHLSTVLEPLSLPVGSCFGAGTEQARRHVARQCRGASRDDALAALGIAG